MDEEEKFIVTNIMEDIVEAKLDSFLADFDICKCALCRADVMALALNHLQPKYVASTSGNVYMHMMANTTQMTAEITVAMTDAVNLVSQRPRHDLSKIVK